MDHARIRVNEKMKIWVVMAKVEELQARSVDMYSTPKKKQSNILENKIGWR